MRIAIIHKDHDSYDIDRPGGAAHANIQIGRWLSNMDNVSVDFFYSGKTTNDKYGNIHYNIKELLGFSKDNYHVIIGSCVIWPVLEMDSKVKIVLMHDRVNKKDHVKFTDSIVVKSNITVICLSRSHVASIRSLGCMNKIKIITNGFDEQCYPRRMSRPQDRFKLIYAAATNETKGLDVVLQNFPILVDLIPHLELTICGDSLLHGSGRESVINKYSDIIDKHNIIVRGYVQREELYELYRNSGVYLAPSREDFVEPCPLGPIDAQVCGLPVVASKSGSLPELVTHGFTGHVMKEYTGYNFVECVMDTISSEIVWKTLVKNCVNSYGTKFWSWEEVAQQYYKVIME